jgi:LmbE family N-acetylglucosaminyl deacetylase
MKKRALVVAAHPDDEVLGCGGSTARLVREGWEVFTLILGEGITSRERERKKKERETEITELKKRAFEANRILGVKEVFLLDFPDNRFDSVDLLSIVKAVEEVKKEVKPFAVFTHSKADLNVDHTLTYRAVLTATRPQPGETVKELYSFEVLSSTEWSFPHLFRPSVYFDITMTLDIKKEAMKCYTSELRDPPHPRSLEGIEVKAKQRGMEVGLAYAEAFELVRSIFVVSPNTLPLQILAEVTAWGVAPYIFAIGSLIVLVSLLLLAIAGILLRGVFEKLQI